MIDYKTHKHINFVILQPYDTLHIGLKKFSTKGVLYLVFFKDMVALTTGVVSITAISYIILPNLLKVITPRA